MGYWWILVIPYGAIWFIYLYGRKQTRNHIMMMLPKEGDHIRRLKDGRLFRVTFITSKVFTAHSEDGIWSSWGGPVSQLTEGETFEYI